MTSLAALVNVCRGVRDYSLSKVIGDGVDTVGVWGSNPHAPTNLFDNLARPNLFSVDPKRSIRSAKVVAFIIPRDLLTSRLDSFPAASDRLFAIYSSYKRVSNGS